MTVELHDHGFQVIDRGRFRLRRHPLNQALAVEAIKRRRESEDSFRVERAA